MTNITRKKRTYSFFRRRPELASNSEDKNRFRKVYTLPIPKVIPPAPALSSISPNFGDAAGGVAVTITGSDFIGATGGTINGVALTSFVVQNDETITAVTPAIVSSNTAFNLQVSGPGGTGTLSSAYTSWDPSSTTTAPTEWWRANFSGSPWTNQIPTNSLSEATNPPAVGSTVNGWAPADFDGSADILQSADDFRNSITATAGAIAVLFNADTADAPAANAYNDPPLVSDFQSSFNLGHTTSGLGLAFYDGVGWIEPTKVAASTAAWHFGLCRWNASNVEIGVDQTSMSSAAHAGSLTGAATYKTTLGQVSISVTNFFDGKILEVLIFNHTLSDGDRTKIRNYFNTRYSLSL